MSTYACTSTLNKTFLLFEHNCLSAYACSAMKKNVTRTRVGSEGRVCVFHLSLSANPTTLAVWCPGRCTFLSHWLLPLSLTSSFGNVQFFSKRTTITMPRARKHNKPVWHHPVQYVFSSFFPVYYYVVLS